MTERDNIGTDEDDSAGEEDAGIARARAAKHGSPFLNTEQAAAYLGLSARKLQYMRSRCTGPRYRLHSRFVRYHIDDLIFWSRSTAPATEGDDNTPSDRAIGTTNAVPKAPNDAPNVKPDANGRRADGDDG